MPLLKTMISLSSGWWTTMEVASILIFNIILYYKTINNDLIMDEFQWVQIRKRDGFYPFTKIRNFSGIKSFLHDRLYSVTTFGTTIKVERCFTIFLHIAICVLMFFALGSNQISFWASILYACNPINNQTSIWGNGRRYAINIILVLLMMIFSFASPLFYFLTGVFQVTAVFSPILIINKSPLFLLMIPVLLILGYDQIKCKCLDRANAMADGDLKTFTPNRLIVIVKTFGFFFFKMIVPQVCAMQYPDRIKWGLTKEGTKDAYKIDKHFYIGVCAIAINFICIVFMPIHYRCWYLFMFLATLQWSAILPITQILSDRYCSLPNIFMMFFLSYLAHFAGIFYVPIMILLVAYYCVCLSVIFPMYYNLTDFYTYHFKHFPYLSWYRHCLIKDLMNEGQHGMACNQTFEGLVHDRSDFKLLIWGSIMSIMKGNLIHAEDFLKEAEKNLYINKEKEGMAEIEDVRKQIKIAIPIEKKKEKLTPREKVIFMKRKGLK